MTTTTLVKQQTARRILDRIGRQVGNTPLVRINSLSRPGVSVYAKTEWAQIGGSVKARAAFGILSDAILSGEWQQGMRILDASSGNTAIAYAAIAAQLSIPVTICMPENATRERKETLRSLRAEIILTSPLDGMEGAREIARNLKAQYPETYFYADQYSNPNNWKAHYRTTAEEIFKQTKGAITHFAAGLGTTGTFCGTAMRLRELVPGIRAVGLQPDAPMHGLEGWKHLESAGAPAIYKPGLEDEMREISTQDAYVMIRRMAYEEQLYISPSSAANLIGAATLANELKTGMIVTVLPDSMERYGEIKKMLLD